MSKQQDPLGSLWAAIEEKALLMEAAGLLLLGAKAQEHRLLRPIIAVVCGLAMWLMPMVSAGEGLSAALRGLAW